MANWAYSRYSDMIVDIQRVQSELDQEVTQLQTDGLRQAVRNADDARNDYHTLPPY